MRIINNITKITVLGKFLAFIGIACIIGLNLSYASTELLNFKQVTSLNKDTFLSLTSSDHLFDGNLTVAAADPGAVDLLFPSCDEATFGTESLLYCLKEVVTSLFYIGIAIFFVRIAFVMINSVIGGDGVNVYKKIKESLYDLFIGIILIGMPIVIMTTINPLTGSIFFGSLAEFNLGPEAVLIDVIPDTSGCMGFSLCTTRCLTGESDSQRATCVSKCKANPNFKSCSKCFSFIDEKGVGLKSQEYLDCIIEEADSTPPKPGSKPTNPNVKPTKLGLFLLGSYSDQAKEAIQSGGVSILTLLNPWEKPEMMLALDDQKNANPNGTIVVRIYVPKSDYKPIASNDPKLHAQRIFTERISKGLNDLANLGSLNEVDYLVMSNEFDNSLDMYSKSETEWNRNFWLELLAQLRQYNTAKNTSIKPCGFSFGVAFPPADGYPFQDKINTLGPVFDQLSGMNGALCYHGYTNFYSQDIPNININSVGDMNNRTNEATTSLRYRAILSALGNYNPSLKNMKVIIGETGVDAMGVNETDGWRVRKPNSPINSGTGTIDDFIDWLDFYNKELNKDSNVIGASLFQSGDTTAWSNFNVDDPKIMNFITGLP